MQDLLSHYIEPCFRVVITTYDRVRGEFKKREAGIEMQSPLFDIDWYRIVLGKYALINRGSA